MEGYDHDRRNQTWHEVHGYTSKEKAGNARRGDQRGKNRKHSSFGKVNWDAYQHDHLYDMIMSADPGAMSERAGQWQRLAARIEATTADVHRAVERVLGAWQGPAAVSSAASNTRLMRWAGDASTTASTVAERMATYAEAVERARRYMPEPAFATAERRFRDGYTVTGTGGASTAVLLKQLLSDGLVSHEEARARKAEAVAVMEAYEAQSKDVHDTMPEFTDVEGGATDVPDWTPAPDQPDVGPEHRTPGTPSPDIAAVPLTAGTDSTTSAAGFLPSTATGGPGALTGGSPGGTGFGGAHGGGLGSLGSGGSDVIRNSPGFGAVGGGVPGRGGAAGVLGGRAGAAGGAFGGMPAGRSGEDDDKEHTNKYAEGTDFFDDLPPAYPPVFGA